jgi:hypothetical protein
MTTIDTAKVADYRKLRFNSIDELHREINMIVEADHAGRLRRSGNWTAGQIFGHIASWITYAYEGYPMKPPSLFIRWFLKVKKKTYLRDGMPRGVRIPGVKDGTFATEPLTTDEGARRLREALERLKSGEPPRYHSPAFGPLQPDERVQWQLRHAEEHLGFLHY